jgi:integrase
VAKIRQVRVEQRLPVVLSRAEVARLIAAAGSLKTQTALSLAYGAGLRAGEVVALKTSDVDSTRMTLRIEQGKGRKDRYAMLSPVMLERLRAWWRERTAASGAGGWLFPGPDASVPDTRQLNRAVPPPVPPVSPSVSMPPWAAFATHLLERRYPRHPGPARAQEARDHGPVCPGGHRDPARGGQSSGGTHP